MGAGQQRRELPILLSMTTSKIKPPAALGFRMPAEWEPQEAIWLSWPHKRTTWPGRFRPIPGVFAQIVAAISAVQAVLVACMVVAAVMMARGYGAN